MLSANSIKARKCVHAQKPYPTQALAHESSKVGGIGKRERKEREERERGKREARRLKERKAAQ